MVFPNSGDFHMKHSDRHLGAKLYARKMIYCIDIEALKKKLMYFKGRVIETERDFPSAFPGELWEDRKMDGNPCQCKTIAHCNPV